MANVNTDLMDTKEFKALAKEIGDKEAKEFLSKSDEDLKTLISSHTMSMEQTIADTKATPAYVSAVEIKKDFDASLRDQLKPLKVAVKLAAKTLNSRKNG